jgi:glycine cleavage system H protein
MSTGNPEELRYADSHEWVRVDGESGTIGITDYAQKQLGEIVYLELPEVGHVYNAGDEFGTVESVKAVSELYTPVSGEVVEVNKGAVAEPGIINDDPFGDGWLVKLKLSTDEAAKLMTAEQYAGYVREEEKEK